MIYVLHGEDTHKYPDLMDEVYRLRHRVFVDEMGWSDLYSPDGRETDQFDRPDAVHHICMRDDRVVGYQRMLPTLRPTLLSELFPHLCEGPIPRSHDCYELTRYAVDPAYREGRRSVGSVGTELIAGWVEWGLNCGVDKTIIEFDRMWVLRALELKFLVRPLGYLTKIENQNIVATQVTYNAETLATVREFGGFKQPVTEMLSLPEIQSLAS